MTSGEPARGAAPLGAGRRRLYRALCFALLAAQGGVLDFYLISFTDLSWCAWIATDVALMSGWAVFFVRSARSQRERACGFHQQSSMFGCSLREFAHAYLAWLVYVIALTPKVLLILETSIVELIALQSPCGVTGFTGTVLLSAPLLFCLVGSVVVDPNGPSRQRAHGCFLSACLDMLDGFALMEPMLRGQLPPAGVKYAVVAAYVAALAVPVVWLYELTAAELRMRWLWARFFCGALVNSPLLAARCVQVFVHGAPVSVFMFKNVFFLLCPLLELLELCVTVRGTRGGGPNPAQFSHCVSENDMCPHGYVNTLAVAQS